MNRPKKEVIAVLIACMPAFFADNSYAGRSRDVRRGRGMSRVVSPTARSRQRVVVPASRRPQPEIVQPEEQFVARTMLPALPNLQEPQEEMGSGIISPQALAQMSPQERKEYIAQILEMAAALDPSFQQKSQEARVLEIERQKAEKALAEEEERAQREQEIMLQEEAELRELLNPSKKEEVKKQESVPQKGKKLDLVIKGAPLASQKGLPKPTGIDVKTYAKIDNALKSAKEHIESLLGMIRQLKQGKIMIKAEKFLDEQRSSFNSILRKIDFSAFVDEKLESMTDQQRKNVHLFVQRNIEKPYQELIDLFANYILEISTKNDTTDRQVAALMDLFESANTKYLSLLQNCQLSLTDVQEKWDAHQLVDMKDKVIEERSKRIASSGKKESIVLDDKKEDKGDAAEIDDLKAALEEKISQTMQKFEDVKNQFVAKICESLEDALGSKVSRISKEMINRFIRDFETKRFNELKTLPLTQKLLEDWVKKTYKIKDVPREVRKDIEKFEREVAKNIEQAGKACNEALKLYWPVREALASEDLKSSINKVKVSSSINEIFNAANKVSTEIDSLKKKMDELFRARVSYRLECFDDLRSLCIERYNDYVTIYNDLYDYYDEQVKKTGSTKWKKTATFFSYIPVLKSTELAGSTGADTLPAKKEFYKK